MKRRALALVALLFCVPVRAATDGSARTDASFGLRAQARPAGSSTRNRAVARKPRRTDPKPINLARTSLATMEASSVNGDRGLDNFWYGALNAFDDGHNPLDRHHTYWLTAHEDRAWVELQFDLPVTVTAIRVDADAAAYHAEFTREDGSQETRAVVLDQADYPAALEQVRRVRIVFDREGADLHIEEVQVMGHPPAGAQFKVGRPRLLVTPRTAALGAADHFNEWCQNQWRSFARRFEDDESRSIVTYSRGGIDVYRVIFSKADGLAIEETLADFTALPEPRRKTEPPRIQLALLSSLDKAAGDPRSFRFLAGELGGMPIDRARMVDLGLDVGALLKLEYDGAKVDRHGCFALFAGNRTTGYWPVLIDRCYESYARAGPDEERSYYVNDVDGDGRLEILEFAGRGEDAILERMHVFDPVTKVFGAARLDGLTRENVENRRARETLDATVSYRTPDLESRARTPIKP